MPTGPAWIAIAAGALAVGMVWFAAFQLWPF
jgi:hypothetical protein